MRFKKIKDLIEEVYVDIEDLKKNEDGNDEEFQRSLKCEKCKNEFGNRRVMNSHNKHGKP